MFSKQRFFNPIKWYVFLTLIAVVASLLITLILWVVLIAVNWFVLDATTQLPLSATLLACIWAVTFTLLILPETGGGFDVPGTMNSALVTWLGMPLPFVLTSGQYRWTGKNIGFGRAVVVFGKDNGGFTDENGFAKAGPITFSVWNTGHSTEQSRNTIVAPAHNRANISANLTLILQIENLRTLLDQVNPAQDIGDRARQEFREFVNSFVDTDIPSLAHVATDVLNGTELITCFIPASIGVYKDGSMIRDRGGRAMFTLIPRKPKNHSDEMVARAEERRWEDKRKKLIEEFCQNVLDEANPELLSSVLKDGNIPGTQEVAFKSIQVKHPIEEVIEKVGLRLLRTTMSDVVFSAPVIAAANQASAEADERVSQVASAETNKKARAAMLPDAEELKNPAWETAMLIQAAQDDKNGAIRIVVVPGADGLTKAAVAGGSQIGGK